MPDSANDASATLTNGWASAMADIDHIRCLTLIGTHGMGKTTLTKALVSRFGQRAIGEVSTAYPSEDCKLGTTQVRLYTLFPPKPRPVQAAPSLDEDVIEMPGRQRSRETLRSQMGTLLSLDHAPPSTPSAAPTTPRAPRRVSMRPGPEPCSPSNRKDGNRSKSFAVVGIREREDLGNLAHASASPTSSALPSRIQRAGSGSASVAGARRARDRFKSQDKTALAKQAPAEVHPPSLLYLLDTPGQADLSGEAAAALRLADSSLLLFDAAARSLGQGGRDALRQALHERVRPAVFCNFLDRCMIDYQMSAPDLEDRLRATIAEVNVVVESVPDELLGDVRIQPHKGLVLFGSTSQNWAFTLPFIASCYAQKFGLDAEAIARELWEGPPVVNDDDDAFDGPSKGGVDFLLRRAAPTSKRVSTSWSGISEFDTKHHREVVPVRVGATLASTRRTSLSALSALVFEPIAQLLRALMEGDSDRASAMLDGLCMKQVHIDRGKAGPALVSSVMSRLWNLQDTLWSTCLLQLPSPKEAQKYQLEDMYRGPEDEGAVRAVRSCDPNGPLVCYVSRLVPVADEEQAEQGAPSKAYGLGRLFSGTLRSGQSVKVKSSSRKAQDHVHHCQEVDTIALAMGDSMKSLPPGFVVPPGNLVALAGPGLHRQILKAATVTDRSIDLAMAAPRAMPQCCRVSLHPKDDAQALPALLESLRNLSRYDPSARGSAEEWGEHVLVGCGPLHLEACLRTVEQDVGRDFFRQSCPGGRPCGREGGFGAVFRETVRSASTEVARYDCEGSDLSFEATAQPLCGKLMSALATSTLEQLGVEERARILADQFGWGPTEGLRLWCFGPEECGMNAVIDTTQYPAVTDDNLRVPLRSSSKGSQTTSGTSSSDAAAALDSYATSVVAAVQWATKEGGLCEEELQGVRFSLKGQPVVLGDIQRGGGGRVISAVRRSLLKAELNADPGLLEALFWLELRTKKDQLRAELRSALGAFGAREVLEEEITADQVFLRTELPLVELLQLQDQLELCCGSVEAAFSRWSAIPDSEVDADLLNNKTIDDKSSHHDSHQSSHGNGDPVCNRRTSSSISSKPSTEDGASGKDRTQTVAQALRRWRQVREEVAALDIGSSSHPLGITCLAQALEDNLEDVVVKLHPDPRLP